MCAVVSSGLGRGLWLDSGVLGLAFRLRGLDLSLVDLSVLSAPQYNAGWSWRSSVNWR